jgi:SAM-dependent methyltransferase
MQIVNKSKCRFCANDLNFSVIDLGMSPLCEKFISAAHLNEMEKFYPLHAFVCKNCWLMQLEEFETPDEIFAVDYSYYSSYSATWVDHARKYTRQMIYQFDINSKSLVVEIASNDGYLLQWFVKEGIPVLGIDPAANIAKAAVEKGVRTEVKFFGREIALELVKNYGKADLLIGNNVLAHVPDINDFVGGMKEMLGTGGVITMEFPHLQRLIEENQFDTIYHEHFSYLSFSVVNRIFNYHGITLFDVEELSTHGGSLRIFGKHSDDKNKIITGRVHELLQREKELGFESVDFYLEIEEKVKETKRKLLMFLIDIKRQNKSVVGYGAPGKGNTLLNYCGIRTDFLDYTVDISPHKQGNFLPGTHIPILHPDQLKKTRPDYILILPWNLKDEIIKQLEYVREWGGKFVIPIPELTVIM